MGTACLSLQKPAEIHHVGIAVEFIPRLHEGDVFVKMLTVHFPLCLHLSLLWHQDSFSVVFFTISEELILWQNCNLDILYSLWSSGEPCCIIQVEIAIRHMYVHHFCATPLEHQMASTFSFLLTV